MATENSGRELVQSGEKQRAASYALLGRFLSSRPLLLGVGLALIMVAMSFISPYFMTLQNIRGLLLGATLLGVISVGEVGVLATAGLDLSVGSTLAATGVVAGIAIMSGIPVWLSIILALLAAAGIGLVNGFFIAKLKLDSFITTLGTMIALRGVLLVISGGQGITNLPDAFNQIGQGTLWGFQYPVYYFLAIAIAGDFLFRKMHLFRLTYYVGSNEEAAMMSGIRVVRVKLLQYVIVAVLAGVAGLIMAARLGMASVTIGGNTALPVLAACVIGGSSFFGGEGTVLGAVLGVFLLQLLANALNIAGIGIYWQQVFTGVIVLGAIALDRFKKR